MLPGSVGPPLAALLVGLTYPAHNLILFPAFTGRAADYPRTSSSILCFAAYDVRSREELLGCTTGRLGDIRQDTLQRHRRDGRAGTTILYHLRILRQTQAPLSDDYGQAEGCWSMGNAAAPAGAVGPFTGLRAGWSSGRRRQAACAAGPADAAAEPPAPQDFPGTTGWQGAADADDDPAGAAVPFEGLLARRIC